MAEWTGQPAYKQVAEDLRDRIRDDRLPVGQQLPSLSELMQEFDVSITVIRMALSELRAEGLVTTHQGKGAFVRAKPGSPAATGSPEFAALMKQLDSVHTHVSRLDERVAQLEALVQPAVPASPKRQRRA